MKEMTPSRRQGLERLLRYGNLRVGRAAPDEQAVVSPPVAEWLVLRRLAVHTEPRNLSITEAGESLGAELELVRQEQLSG